MPFKKVWRNLLNMKIKILGSRANIKIHQYKHELYTGILIDDLILIDVGEENFLNYKPKLILITHYHPDHAFFVKEHFVLNNTAEIYGPEKNTFAPTAKIINQAINWNNYKITPIETIHSIKVKSQGYVIENKNKRLFFCSDMAWIKKDVQNQLGQFDVIISEASHIKKGGFIFKNKKGELYGHTGIPDLIKIFKNHTNRIVFIHQGSWFIRDIKSGTEKIKDLEEKNLSLEMAYDGQEYFI